MALTNDIRGNPNDNEDQSCDVLIICAGHN